MIIETLVTAFVVGFVAIVVLGHILLLQALLPPARPKTKTDLIPTTKTTVTRSHA
jgi:hypothetical protein